MPSSHSALVTSTAAAVGLYYGFNNPVFGVATAIAMIVVYDATGIRRQAGMQAQKINILVEELLKGHPISEEHLREVLGHTRWRQWGGVTGPGSGCGPVVGVEIINLCKKCPRNYEGIFYRWMKRCANLPSDLSSGTRSSNSTRP